jgi:hypothetical protein
MGDSLQQQALVLGVSPYCSTTEFTIYIFSEIVQDNITEQKLCKSKVFILDT